MKKKLFMIFALISLRLAAAILVRADSIPFSIAWWTVDNGGGLSSGGDFSVNGTVGQFDVNQEPSNGVYTISGGFWPAPLNNDPIQVFLPAISNQGGPPLD